MRKLVVLVLVGIFCCFGVAMAKENPQARLIADDYGLVVADVQNLVDAKWSWPDINQAAFLSVAAEVELAEVVKYKGIGAAWPATINLLGVTDWHIKMAQEQLIATQLYQLFGTEQAAVLRLLAQKYHPLAIAIAAALATQTSASMDYILAQKLDGRSWYETAKNNGVSPAQLDKLLQQLRDAFGKRATIGDTYGAYGRSYGYQDANYYQEGYNIEILQLAKTR